MFETLLAFAITAAYWPGIPGMALTPRWALLSIVVPASLLVLPSVSKSAAWVGWVFPSAGCAFLGYAALSLFWTTSLPDGLNAFWQLLLLAGCVWIGFRLPSLDRVYLGTALGMGVTSAIIVLEVCGVDVLRQLTQLRPGLFFNPNIVTESAALVFIACFASRQYWASLLPLPALLLTHSRGGIWALAIVAMVWMFRRSHGGTVVLAAVLFGLSTWVYQNNQTIVNNAEFRGGIALNGESTRDRINMWRDTVWGLTWRGTGIGSFRSEFLKAPYREGANVVVKGRTDHAHNDFLEVAYELGIFGLVCFLLLAWNGLRGSGEPERLVVIAFLAEAIVQFPLHMPVTGAIAALCLGHCSRSALPSELHMPQPQWPQS